MSMPRTPLLVAPSDEQNLLGRAIDGWTLAKGLRRINPRLFIPDPSTYDKWYPGKGLGMTCVWDGPIERGRKVCAFSLAAIPEFTQACPDGIQVRGWRSIFEKCIGARVATRAQIEREFKVNLSYDGRDKVCTKCQEDGLRVTVDGASGLCDSHESAANNALKAKAARKEAQSWLNSQ